MLRRLCRAWQRVHALHMDDPALLVRRLLTSGARHAAAQVAATPLPNISALHCGGRAALMFPQLASWRLLCICHARLMPRSLLSHDGSSRAAYMEGRVERMLALLITPPLTAIGPSFLAQVALEGQGSATSLGAGPHEGPAGGARNEGSGAGAPAVPDALACEVSCREMAAGLPQKLSLCEEAGRIEVMQDLACRRSACTSCCAMQRTLQHMLLYNMDLTPVFGVGICGTRHSSSRSACQQGRRHLCLRQARARTAVIRVRRLRSMLFDALNHMLAFAPLANIVHRAAIYHGPAGLPPNSIHICIVWAALQLMLPCPQTAVRPRISRRLQLWQGWHQDVELAAEAAYPKSTNSYLLIPRFLGSLPAAAAVEAGLTVVASARDLAQRSALVHFLGTLAGNSPANGGTGVAAPREDAGLGTDGGEASAGQAGESGAGAVPTGGGGPGLSRVTGSVLPAALLARLRDMQLGLAALAQLPAPWDARLAHLAGAHTRPEQELPQQCCKSGPPYRLGFAISAACTMVVTVHIKR